MDVWLDGWKAGGQIDEWMFGLGGSTKSEVALRHL